MSWKRKQIEVHKALRQSGLFNKRVVRMKTLYKRHDKHKSKSTDI